MLPGGYIGTGLLAIKYICECPGKLNLQQIITMPLSTSVSEQRRKKGFTQEELASRASVTVRTIQRIESGEILPRSFTLKAIADALGIPFETLATDETQPGLPATPLREDPVSAESSDHFLHLFFLSCFSYLILPYVHFLIPVKVLKKHSMLPQPVVKLAQKVIRGQIQWTIGFHLLLLLTLAYNILQAQYGSREYLISYLWIVLGMYLLNALLIGYKLRQSNRASWKEAPVSQ